MEQRSAIFERQKTKTLRLNYLLALPREYGTDGGQRWPLVLFLHGAGERGADLERVKLHGIPKIVGQWDNVPFIAVSPQCPAGTTWVMQIDALDALLDELAQTYAVDLERVYLTGLSLGGNGSWHLAAAYPERFAAVVPICGWGEWWGGFPEQACVLKQVPIWAFHGAQDTVVPLAGSQQLVEALRTCGGNVRFTIYPDAGHDSWTETYANPELYTWLLGHRRGQDRGEPA